MLPYIFFFPNLKSKIQNPKLMDHFVQALNVTELVASGRARWKTENENHNVLKTKGYHLEHNFGLPILDFRF
jgi:hypothetical protein